MCLSFIIVLEGREGVQVGDCIANKRFVAYVFIPEKY